MSDSERTIDEALIAEERALLRSIGDEPGYIDQAMGLFAGRNGWVNGILMAAQALLFAGGVWAAWRFFAATTTLDALHWGIPAAVALVMALIIKMSLYPIIHIQRLLRELKRMELTMGQR
ncbi:hypothetical protein J4558_01690 [Leptolyngbya sp. 15MV]|nr:hypothetical protein J4558_01690 [Leptolyngbya sp. 15MV]